MLLEFKKSEKGYVTHMILSLLVAGSFWFVADTFGIIDRIRGNHDEVVEQTDKDLVELTPEDVVDKLATETLIPMWNEYIYLTSYLAGSSKVAITSHARLDQFKDEFEAAVSKVNLNLQPLVWQMWLKHHYARFKIMLGHKNASTVTLDNALKYLYQARKDYEKLVKNSKTTIEVHHYLDDFEINRFLSTDEMWIRALQSKFEGVPSIKLQRQTEAGSIMESFYGECETLWEYEIRNKEILEVLGCTEK